MDSSRIKSSLRHIRRRKSLTCRKSISVKPAGNLKCQISNVLENNRKLASSLEETRCELSDKQKILDEYSGHITNMKFARFKMLEMSSALKSFVRSFDEILPLLHVEETTYFEPRLRFRYHTKNLSSLEKIQESPNEIIQADSVPIGEKIVKCNNETDKNPLISPSASEDLITKATVTVDGDSSVKNLDLISNNNSLHCFNDVENISLSKDSNIAEAEFHELPVSFPSDSEDAKKAAAVDNFVPATEELTGTPRLSSPIKRLVKEQAALMFGSNKVSNRSPLSTTSNVLKPFTKLSDNIQLSLNSKIPKFKSFCKSKRKIEDKIASKSSKSIKVAEESDSSVSRRKTFVKEVNPPTTYELPIISNKIPNSEDLLNKNTSQIGPESGKTNKSRKTFVVKAADNLEDFEISPCDRRKTFVKKTCKARKMSVMGKNKIDLEDLPSATSVTQLNQNDIPNNESLPAVVQPDNLKQALCDDVSATGRKTSYASSTKVNKFVEPVSDQRVNLGENKMVSSFEKDSFEKTQQNEVNIVTVTKTSEIENIDEKDRAKSEEINCGTKYPKNVEIIESEALNVISDKQVFATVTKLSKTENVGKSNKVDSKEITHGPKISKNTGTTESDTFNIVSDKQVSSTSDKTKNVNKNNEVESNVMTRGTKKLKNKVTTESDTLNIISNEHFFSTSNETENVNKNDEVESKVITGGTKNFKNKGTTESDTLNINCDKQIFLKSTETENFDKNNGVESKAITHGTKNFKRTTESDILNINSDKQDFSTSNKIENVIINEVESKVITSGTKKFKNKGTTESDTLNINSDKQVFSTSSETVNVDKNDKVRSKEISFGTNDLKNDESTKIYVLNITSNNLLNDNEIEELNESQDDIFIADLDKNISDILESSDSYIEIPDLDLDFSPNPVFKTVPVRGRISKSKPKKVFKFDGYKRKSTSHKISIGYKSKIIKQSTNICQPDVDHQNNIELENQNNQHSNVADNNSNVAASYKSSDDKCQDAAKKHELAKSLDKNTKFKKRNQKECVDLKDSIASTSSKNDFPTESAKHPCSHLIVMDEQIRIDYQNKKSEVKNPASRNFRSPKRIANGDSMKSLRKKSKMNAGKIKIIDCEEDGDILSENETDNLKQENHLSAKAKKKCNKTSKKVRNKKKTPNISPENTFLAQAEIHSPPPCFRTLENDSLDKENEGIMPIKRLSIVLNDVMKINPKTETDVSDRGKMKNPLSSSSSNIHPPEVSDKDAADDQSESEGSKVTRSRRTKPVCYKEISLNTKLRRT